MAVEKEMQHELSSTNCRVLCSKQSNRRLFSNVQRYTSASSCPVARTLHQVVLHKGNASNGSHTKGVAALMKCTTVKRKNES